MWVENSVAIEGFRGVSMAVSATGATSAILERGTYDIRCDVDVYVRVSRVTTGTTDRAQDVTTANGYKIPAGNIVPVEIPDGGFLGAIAGGAGTLSYHRIN